MISLGFDIGDADGIFGAKTENAVKAIQTKLGLVVDGKVGDLTKNAIHCEYKAIKNKKDEDSDSLKSEDI